MGGNERLQGPGSQPLTLAPTLRTGNTLGHRMGHGGILLPWVYMRQLLP